MERRFLSTVLYLGYGAYMFLCVGFQIMLFKEYAAGFNGVAHISCVPFVALLSRWELWDGAGAMSAAMWFKAAGVMLPFGFSLFMWVEDCDNLFSVSVITLCFGSAMSLIGFLLVGPLFDIDFLVAIFCGSLAGYGAAFALVEVLFAKRMHPMLSSVSTSIRKTA